MKIPPWVPDWNGNGQQDIGDAFMDYMIFRQVTGADQEDDSDGNNDDEQENSC